MAFDFIHLGEAMGLSFILIVIIIVCAHFIYYYRGRHKEKEQPFILLRVLLDKNDHASLSAFQFLAWTLLIAFLYITLWFFQLLETSTIAPEPISPELMALMGISVAIPIGSQGIASFKNLKPRAEGDVYFEPKYASMLEEDGRPSLLRVQMFLWTLAALAIYTGLFFAPAFSEPPGTLHMPSIDTTLLFLMGLSATGYLGNAAYGGKVEKAKAPATLQPPGQPATTVPVPMPVRLSPIIREIIPRDVEPNGVVTLLGSGFGGQPDTIMIGEDRVPPAAIRRWEETRIEFTMPETVSLGNQNFRVISGGETASGQISVSSPQWTRGLSEIDATIKGDIWIDDPSQKGYKLPPIGYFISDHRYYFFFEFEVPPGTPPWGRIQFRAKFFLNGEYVVTRSFLPGTMNGQNYGNFDHVFQAEGKYHIEIRGVNTKSMDIEVKKPPRR